MPREERFYDEKDAINEYNNYKKENDAKYMVYCGGFAVIALVVLLIYNLS